MKILSTVTEVRECVGAWRKDGERIALVPTMGNLHDGHLSLIAEARRRAGKVIVSVFVNPLQFGPNEDFARYPRTREQDVARLRTVAADAMFHPSVAEMYPLGPERSTRIEVPELSDILCGAFRPGHFQGVATVVAKLFNIVQPDLAVFGEKDYQQLVIIRRMVADLCLPVEVVGMPTVREPDGLAMSSRNLFLGPQERAKASTLYRSLQEAATKLRQGRRDFEALQREGREALERAGFSVDYFEIRSEELGAPADTDRALIVLTAARLGNTRLIDNLRVNLS